jgi:hypothetical protein
MDFRRLALPSTAGIRSSRLAKRRGSGFVRGNGEGRPGRGLRSLRSPAVVRLAEAAVDTGDDFIATVPGPFGIVLSGFRIGEIDNMMGPAGEHFAVDCDALPPAMVVFLVEHRVAPGVADAPLPALRWRECRGHGFPND